MIMLTKRFKAFAIDFFLTAIIQAILTFSFIILPLIKNELNSPIFESFIRVFIIVFICYLYLLIRDILNISLGKIIFKIKIYDNRTNSEASNKQKILRNVTWITGPIEIIYYLKKATRLGDKIAKTYVK
ncbi:MAG: RDD family protein [Spirochaetales bacterium]|nr:RDD family protein [Spirochaetales bacterium]